jgi:hypothetical protein
MHSIFAVAAGLSCLSVVSAAPFKFPLSNGFPNVSNPSSTLTQIETAAHGSLPNGAPPGTISEDTKTSLKLIAFNELAEVAFFTELIYNITNQVEGYHNHDVGDDQAVAFVLGALNAVVAQEELHALNANGALAHFNEAPIQPCEYNFPVSSFKDAIALASTFTDVVLGTLQDVQSLLATDGDAGLLRGVGSVMEQEGEQNGFYRTILEKIPSALPFLTTSTREFAFSALNQGFVVSGTCPNINTIDLPIFKALTIESKNIDAKSETLEFSIAPISGMDYTTLSLVYINQQNTPVVESLSDISVSSDKVTFKALFPFNGTTFGNGLTIAALVSGATVGLTNADLVAKATIAGPGLIEIN